MTTRPIPIVWTRRAQQDVQRAFRFLAPKSPMAAQRAVAVIHQTVLRLSAFPQSGRPVPELASEYRELFIPFGEGGYALMYFFDGHIVEIQAIKHIREVGY